MCGGVPTSQDRASGDTHWRMPSRRLVTTVALPIVSAVLLTSCTSSGNRSGDKSSTASSSSATAGHSTDLAKSIRTGIGTLRSAHFTVDSKIGGQPLTGAGDQQLNGGRLTALAAQATLPGGLGNVALVVIGGKTYAKLPKPLADATKPWTLIRSDSSNGVVKQLAEYVDAALTGASLGNLGAVAEAAKSVENLGAAAVDGTATTHYKIVVDPAKLPSDLASAGLGDKAIPADLYLDKSGRPVKIRVALTVSGQATDTTVVFSRFDAPVSIQEPPANQVATG